MYRATLTLQSQQREELIDMTELVDQTVKQSGVLDGMVFLYAQGATAGLMIQENWDDSVQEDVVAFLAKLIPRGVWRHDLQDGNGDAHLKSGLIGPSEAIPLVNGNLGLSRWQNIFFCEFDGPRKQRKVVCTVL